MTSTPKHLSPFEGGNALSSFRAQALLPRLQGVSERITAVSAQYVHWVWSEAPLARADEDRLSALLRYGEPAAGALHGPLIVVAPRLGTVSPWASKATDIAHNCGLAIRRVERVTQWCLALDSAPRPTAYVVRPPWGLSKVAKPHLLKSGPAPTR